MQTRSESGQLLLPMLALLFLFGMFCVVYIQWCRHHYWKMRMDIAADLVALSAAREEARSLNYIAGYQVAENFFLQKIGLTFGSFDLDVGEVQVVNKISFKALNAAMKVTLETFRSNAVAVAYQVGKSNGVEGLPVPTMPIDALLIPKKVKIIYLFGIYPRGYESFDAAYYARRWGPRTLKAQPTHRSRWTVCRLGICSQGNARLVLDADPSDPLVNGGFPEEHASFLRAIGIQSFYPQFRAQRIPK